MLTEPKVFRLKKISLFGGLDPHKLYLATETDNGYVIKINSSIWMGMPRSIVEKSPKLFSPYNREAHKNIKKRKRIFLTRKNPNHV